MPETTNVYFPDGCKVEVSTNDGVSYTLTGGESVQILDDYIVDIESGGLQFNFKGANEDGVKEMPVTFQARRGND